MVVLVQRPEFALVAVTAMWGATFLIVGHALQQGSPSLFVGVRFLLAGLVSALVFRRALRGMRWIDVGAGVAIGVPLYLGYGLQTYGQQTVTASATAFITALYVPLVPLLQVVVLRKLPRPMALLGLGLAFAGLMLLAGPGADAVGFGLGEAAILVATVAIAAEIVLIGFFAERVDFQRITVVQLLAAGALGIGLAPAFGEPVPAVSWAWWGSALGLGVMSCVIQLTMNWAQRTVSPTRATVIYAGEPVWAGVFGRLAGERLPPAAFLGAALIVLGVVTSELRVRSREGGAATTEAEMSPVRNGDSPEPVPGERGASEAGERDGGGLHGCGRCQVLWRVQVMSAHQGPRTVGWCSRSTVMVSARDATGWSREVRQRPQSC